MTSRLSLFVLLLLLHVARQAQSQQAELEASAGFELEKVLSYQGAQAFTWDDHGQGWLLSGSGNRVIVSTVSVPRIGEIQPLRSFQRLGNGRSTLLVSGNNVFVSDGAVIRSFPANGSRSEGTVHVPP